MAFNRREFAGLLGVGAVLALAGFPSLALAQDKVSVEDLMQPSPLGEKTLGDPKAPVTVVEYASMTCSHCQHFQEVTFHPFKEKYVDTGKVYYILREFPLDPLAAAAIMLARCAPNDSYFTMVDLLFNKQREWAFVDDPVTALLNIAKQTGFTEDSFKACLTNQELLDGVNSVRDRAAEKFGVNATPTFFINGERHPGALSIEELDAIIQPMLNG